MSMTDEDRIALEKVMSGDIPGLSEIFTAVPDERALGLFVIHALRESAGRQREISQTMNGMGETMVVIKEQLIRWEAHVRKIDDLDKEVRDLTKEVSDLKEEKQRRAGMQWLVEWVAKYVPWFAAAAAAVWALKSNPPG